MLITVYILYFLICISSAVVIGILAMALAPTRLAHRYKRLQERLRKNEKDFKDKKITYSKYMSVKHKTKTQMEEILEIYQKAYAYETVKELKEELQNYSEEENNETGY